MAGIGPTLTEFGRDAAGYLGAFAAKQLFGAGVDALTRKPDIADRAHAALNAAKHQALHLMPEQGKASWDNEAAYLQYLKDTPYEKIANQPMGRVPGFGEKWKPKAPEHRIPRTAVDTLGDKEGQFGFTTASSPPVHPDVERYHSSKPESNFVMSQYGYTTADPQASFSEKSKPGVIPHQLGPPSKRKQFALNQRGTVPPEKGPNRTFAQYADYEPFIHGSQRNLRSEPSPALYSKQQEMMDDYRQGRINLAVPLGAERKTYNPTGGSLGGASMLEEMARSYDPRTGLYGARPIPTVPRPNARAPPKPGRLAPRIKPTIGPSFEPPLSHLEEKYKSYEQRPFVVRKRTPYIDEFPLGEWFQTSEQIAQRTPEQIAQLKRESKIVDKLMALEKAKRVRKERAEAKRVADDEEKLLKATRKLKADLIKEQDAKEAVRIIESAVIVPPKTKKQIREEREKLHNPVARAEAKAKAPKVKKPKKVIVENPTDTETDRKLQLLMSKGLWQGAEAAPPKVKKIPKGFQKPS